MLPIGPDDFACASHSSLGKRFPGVFAGIRHRVWITKGRKETAEGLFDMMLEEFLSNPALKPLFSGENERCGKELRGQFNSLVAQKKKKNAAIAAARASGTHEDFPESGEATHLVRAQRRGGGLDWTGLD